MTDYETRKAHARSVAAKYFGETMRTPEQLVEQVRPPRARIPEPTPEPTPLTASMLTHKDLPRWSKEKKLAFDLLGAHAMYIAAAKNAVSVTVYEEDGHHKHYGHNRGMWLVRFGTTASWRDTVTTLINRIPFLEVSADRRIWTLDAESANKLALAVTDMISEKAEEYGYETSLMHGFQDVGPSLNWPILFAEISTLAARINVACWSDVEVSQLLDRALAEGEMQGITPYHRLPFEHIIDQLQVDDMRRQLPHAFINQPGLVRGA